MEEETQKNNEYSNVVNNDEPPEYLKESIEKSNRATDNSQDSVNMKDFLQEPNGNGLGLSNILKKPDDDSESLEAEKNSQKEIYKKDVTNYLMSLFEAVNEKVCVVKKEEREIQSIQLAEENKNNQTPQEINNMQENNLEDLNMESMNEAAQKKVHFRSTETEIKGNIIDFQDESEKKLEGGPKFEKIKLLPDFLKKTPLLITETSKNSFASFASKIKEKTANLPSEEQNKINENEIKYYEISAQFYLCSLYKNCAYRTSLCVGEKSENLAQNVQTPKKTEEFIEKGIKTEQSSKPAKSLNKHPLSANANIKQISKSVTKTRPHESKPEKPVKKVDPLKELQSIRTEKEKIHYKIQEIEGKLTSIPPVLEPLRTPTKVRPHFRTTPQKSQNDADVFLKKMQDNKQEFELKKAQKMEEKESLLKADLEKLNTEKQKILEVFKLEKEKLFWRKMHELEERKADRIQKDVEYKHLVKGMIKNNQFPIKTTELDKRKQEIAQKKKLLTDYSQKVRLEQIERSEKSPPKKPKEKAKKTIRSITPNQRPNYLLEIKQKNKEYQEKAGVRLKKDCENWEKYLKDEKLNKNEKYTSVLNRAQIMENQAKMKEKVASFNTHGIDIEVENEINELYVDSIKAKIALLEKLKD